MKQQKLLKWGLKSKLGDKREDIVKNYFETQGHFVENADFVHDVVHKIDLVVHKKTGSKLYVQVKGFHKEWKDEDFSILINKAKEDKAIPLIARVNKNNQIYFWNPTKK